MKLVLLLTAVVLGLAAAVGIGKAAASGFLTISTLQDSSTTTIGDSTVTLPPTIAVTEPKPDMTRAEFRDRRNKWHQRVEVRRWEKCVHHAAQYQYTIYQIKPQWRQEVVNYWKKKAIHWREHSYCWHKLNTGNFDWILYRASKRFGVSYNWIHDCSHDEGNTHYRGPIYNRLGSGAFGWMQFMPSTFEAHDDDAFAVVRSRGLHVPNRFKYVSSKIGQAVTASYMFYRGWSSQWTGGSCN